MGKVFYFYAFGKQSPITNMSSFGITVRSSEYSRTIIFPKDFVGHVTGSFAVSTMRFSGQSLSFSGISIGGLNAYSSNEVRIYPAGTYAFETWIGNGSGGKNDATGCIAGIFLE